MARPPTDAFGCSDSEAVCLNDQGGDSINVEKDGRCPTLRSQTHGNLPVVAKAVDCLTPWDTQQARIYADEGASPTLAGADGGGGRNPAGLVYTAGFCAGAGAKAQGIGFEEECAPTLKGGGGGFQMPTVLCAKELTEDSDAVYPINTQIASRHKALGERTGFGVGEDGDPAFTLQHAHCHAVAVGVHQNQCGEVNTSPTAYTLSTSSNASARNAPLVAHPQISGTLCASGAGLSRPAGMASETDLCVSYCLQGSMVGRQDRNGPNGSGVNDDVSFTLNTIDRHAVVTVGHPKAVAFSLDSAESNSMKSANPNSGCRETDTARTIDTTVPCPSKNQGGIAIVQESDTQAFIRERSDKFSKGDIASTQTARQHKDSTDLVCTAVDCRNLSETEELSGTLQAKGSPGYSLNCQNPVRMGYVVRRLTPIECERLQGYPDGWTEYGADGKPISDTARYQMLGNSVAVPCVAYIMQGIAEVFAA